MKPTLQEADTSFVHKICLDFSGSLQTSCQSQLQPTSFFFLRWHCAHKQYIEMGQNVFQISSCCQKSLHYKDPLLWHCPTGEYIDRVDVFQISSCCPNSSHYKDPLLWHCPTGEYIDRVECIPDFFLLPEGLTLERSITMALSYWGIY